MIEDTVLSGLAEPIKSVLFALKKKKKRKKKHVVTAQLTEETADSSLGRADKASLICSIIYTPQQKKLLRLFKKLADVRPYRQSNVSFCPQTQRGYLFI